MPAPAAEWTDELIDEMINLMESGETLTAIAKRKNMPSAPTMWRWEHAQDELGERMTRARELGYIARAEKAIERAHNAEDPQKARLAFDADRWFLAKMCPKRFGDKLDLTSAGERLSQQASPEQRFARLAAATVKMLTHEPPPDDTD
jgi:hypothetical protein